MVREFGEAGGGEAVGEECGAIAGAEGLAAGRAAVEGGALLEVVEYDLHERRVAPCQRRDGERRAVERVHLLRKDAARQRARRHPFEELLRFGEIVARCGSPDLPLREP